MKNFILIIVLICTSVRAFCPKCVDYVKCTKKIEETESNLSFTEVIWKYSSEYYTTNPSVNPNIVLAQAILETGWGNSELFKKSNNAFSIKYFGKGCPADKCIVYGGNKYRKYKSIKDSFTDYIDVIERVYANCLAENSIEAQITCIAERYAEDPLYAKKVIQIINQLNSLP